MVPQGLMSVKYLFKYTSLRVTFIENMGLEGKELME